MIVSSVSPPSDACSSATRPPSKRTTRSRTTVPSCRTSGLVEVTVPSVRAGSGVVNTSSVGRFGMCSIPSTVSKRAACQADEPQQPDRQVGAGALVVERVEALRREALGAAHERVGPCPPRGDRVVLVEPQDVQQLVLEPLEPLALRVEVREHELGPHRRGTRADRPVRRAVVDDLDALLDRRQPVAADAHGVEVGHQPWRARARRARRARRAGRRARRPARPARTARSRASPRARTRSARASRAGRTRPRRRTSRRAGTRWPPARARGTPCPARSRWRRPDPAARWRRSRPRGRRSGRGWRRPSRAG